MKLIYRSHTILHQAVNQFFMNMWPFMITILYLGLISGGFIIFRSDNYIFRTILLTSVLTLCIALCAIYTLAYQITVYSAEFLHSFRRSTRPKIPVDQRFFKSCRPIYTYIGRFCCISRNTFPSVLHEIILNALITLLLTIPDTR